MKEKSLQSISALFTVPRQVSTLRKKKYAQYEQRVMKQITIKHHAVSYTVDQEGRNVFSVKSAGT